MTIKEKIKNSLSKIQSCIILSYQYENLNEFKRFSYASSKLEKIKELKKKDENQNKKIKKIETKKEIKKEYAKLKIIIDKDNEKKEIFYPINLIDDNEKKRREIELKKIKDSVNSCQACPLHTSRKNAISGEGVVNPILLIIGDFPSYEDDENGLAFSDEVGNYLDKWLKAIHLNRDTNCFVSNIVKCTTPMSEDPSKEELKACSNYIIKQIEILQPIRILALGELASSFLAGKKIKINKKKEDIMLYKDIPFIATYHPSEVLRNLNLKEDVWHKLKKLRDSLMELVF